MRSKLELEGFIEAWNCFSSTVREAQWPYRQLGQAKDTERWVG